MAAPRPEAPTPRDDRKTLQLTESDRIAVEAACKELEGYESIEVSGCEAAHRFDDFLVIRAFRKLAEGYMAAWYVVRSFKGKPRILRTTQTLRGGEDITELDIVCWTDTPETKVPDGAGLLSAELRDIDLDGRDDLMLECRELSRVVREEDRRYLKVCTHSGGVCAEDIELRHVVSGEVELDSSVEFRDGKLVRTVRTAKNLDRYHNVMVIDEPIAGQR